MPSKCGLSSLSARPPPQPAATQQPIRAQLASKPAILAGYEKFRLRLTQPCPRSAPAFTPPFDDHDWHRDNAAPVCGSLPVSSPPAPRGPRFVRVVLSRSSSLADLIRQSGELPATSRHPPVIGAVLDIHRVILSALLTFRTFTAGLSRIAAFNTPGTRCVLFSVPSAPALAIGQGRKIAVGIAHSPLESAPCGANFRRFIRSLSLRPS